jgi:hypothetical protein
MIKALIYIRVVMKQNSGQNLVNIYFLQEEMQKITNNLLLQFFDV